MSDASATPTIRVRHSGKIQSSAATTLQNSLAESIARNARLWFSFEFTCSSNRTCLIRESAAANRAAISGVSSVLALSTIAYSQWG